jgi:fatty-acyl-CoA synthase
MQINFGRLVANLARLYGEREALVHIERQRRYSFRELHALGNRIANMLSGRLELGRGDRYLLILKNDNLSLMHQWTCFKAEAAAAFAHHGAPIAEHAWQIDLIEPKVVFLEGALLAQYYPMLHQFRITVVSMDPLPEPLPGAHYFWDLLDGVPETQSEVEHDAGTDIVLYRFTGGAGEGKCIPYTLDNWLGCRDTLLAHDERVFTPECRFLHATPLSMGTGSALLAPFFRGGCTVTQNAADPVLFCDTVAAERVTATLLLPAMLCRLLELGPEDVSRLGSLRTVIYGGAMFGPGKLAELVARFGPIFVQAYGCAEQVAPAAMLGKGEHCEGAHVSLLASAGRVAAGGEVMVADEDGNELPPGALGELWLRSRGTIHGYYRNPQASAAAFCDGFWKSGDLGYMDGQGYLYIVDRKQDLIVSGDCEVYAVEVELALCAHPAVAMAVAVGIPHPALGHAVHAEVVLRAGCEAAVADLLAQARARLGADKAPRSVAIVAELPLNAAGKPARRVVQEKYDQGGGRCR